MAIITYLSNNSTPDSGSSWASSNVYSLWYPNVAVAAAHDGTFPIYVNYAALKIRSNVSSPALITSLLLKNNTSTWLSDNSPTAPYSTTTTSEIGFGFSDVVFLNTDGSLKVEVNSSAPPSLYFNTASVTGAAIKNATTDATIFSDKTIFGYLNYIAVPSSPGITNISNITNDGFSFKVSVPSFTGGESINGYRIQIATDTAFTQNLQTQDISYDGTNTTVNVTGKNPNTRYYIRAFAKNPLWSFAGKGSQWSNTATVQTAIYLPTFSDSSIVSSAYTGLSYSDQVTATSSALAGSITYAATGLPSGLSISSSTGAITGTPTTVGNSAITFTATNTDGQTVSPTRYLFITDSATLWFGPNLLDTAKTGLNYTANVYAFNATSYSVSTGQLPSGISLNTTTGEISGKTYDIGSFTFDITANISTDGGSGSITKTFTMTSEKSNVSAGLVSTPSNLYAERVYAEQPLALWSMDENVDYISKISENQRDMAQNWDVLNGDAAEFSDVTFTPPMASMINMVTVPDYEESPDAVLEATNLVTNPSMETGGASGIVIRENLIQNPTMDGIVPSSSQSIATNLATNPNMVTTSGTTTIRENLLANPSFEKVANGTDIVRSNLISNPSFELNTSGWTNLANTLLSRVPDNSIVGSYVAKLEATAGGTGSNFFAANTGSALNLVDPDKTYTFSVYVKSTTAKTIGIRHAWVDASQNVIGSINTFSATSLSANTWTRISTTQTAPENAYRVSVGVIGSASESWAPGDIIYIDGAMLEDSLVATTYFDGSLQDSLSEYYSWTETEHNSPSIQTAQLVTTLTNIAPNPNMAETDGVVDVKRNHANNPVAKYVGGSVDPAKQVSRTNLVANSSFETVTIGWQAIGTATLAPDGGQFFDGLSSAKLTCLAVGDGIEQVLGERPTVSPNTPYTLSVYVKGEAGKKAILLLDWFDASDTYISQVSSSSYTMTGDWQRMYFFGAISPNNAVTASINVRNLTSGAHTFYLDAVLFESSRILEPYFNGNTTDQLGFEYVWADIENNSVSRQLSEQIVIKENKIYNPSFENGFFGWSDVGINFYGFELSSDVAPGLSTKSLQVIAGANSGLKNLGIQALPSTQYTFSAWIKGPAGKTSILGVRYYDSSMTELSSPFPNFSSSIPFTGDWQRAYFTFTSPANTAYVEPEIQVQDISLTTFYVDDVMLEEGSTLNNYYDGNSVPSEGLRYKWSDEINDSTSIMYALPAKGFDCSGTQSIMYASNDATTESFARYYATSTHNNIIEVGAVSGLAIGTQYLFKAQVRSSTSRTFDYLIGANGQVSVALVPYTWKEVNMLYTVSATNTNVQLTLPSMVAGETFDIKEVLVEKTSGFSRPYFDGDFVSTDSDLTYGWRGEPHDSNSVLLGAKVYGVADDNGLDIRAFRSEAWSANGTRSLRIINYGGFNNDGITIASVDQTTYGSLNIPQLLPGKTYTVKAVARLNGTVSGSTYSRSICFATGSTIVSYVQAPNTIGTHELSLTFTVPADSTNHRIFLTSSGYNNPYNYDMWWDKLLIVRGEYDGLYFDGDTANEEDRYYSWAGEPSKSVSYRQGLGLYGWTGVNAAPVYELGHSRSGTASAFMRVSDNVEYPRMTSDNVPVLSGFSYSASAYMQLASDTNSRISIDWKDSAGVLISRSETSIATSPTGRISVSGVAPDGATQASVSLGFDDGTIASTQLSFDDVLFEQSPTINSYFDGDSLSVDGLSEGTIDWSGDDHASSSTVIEAGINDFSSILGKTSTYSISSVDFSGGKAARVFLRSSSQTDIAVNTVNTTEGNTYTLLIKARANSRSQIVYPQISGDVGDPVLLQQGVWTEIRMIGTAVTGATETVGLRLLNSMGHQFGDTIDIDYAMVVDGEYYNGYFDGSISNSELDGTVSWFGTPNNSISTLSGPEIYFWNGYNGGIVSSSSTVSNDSGYSALVLTSASDEGITSSPMPTVIGEPYTFSAYIYVKKQENVTIQIDEASRQVVVQPNTWTRVSHSRIASSTTHTVRLLLANGGGIMFVDNALFEKGSSVLSYFDGETTNPDADLEYDWSGTAHQSSSTLSGTAVAGYTNNGSVALIQSSVWDSTGSKSMRMVSLSKSNESGTSGALYNISTLTNGKKYTAMVKYRLTSPLVGDKNPEYLTLRAANSSGTTVVRTSNGSNTTGVHELKLVFTKTSEITAIHLSSGVGSGAGTVWWDDFLIVEGEYNGTYFDGDSVDSEVIGENVFEWTGTPHASASTKSILQTSLLTTMVSPSLGSVEDFNAEMESIAFSAWIYPFARIIDAYIGYRYTDVNGIDIEHIQKFDINQQDTWSLISYSFKLPTQFTNLRMVIKTLVALPTKTPTTDSYKFLVHGMTAGQWSESFFTRSLGATVQELTDEIAVSGTGVFANAYGLQRNNGYYMAYDNRLAARNTGIPMVYGATNSTKITPAPTAGDPSFVFPGLGFMNASGQYANLTLELWLKIQSSATQPRRILGPVAEGSTDGLYVNDGLLVLKVGESFDSYFIKEWDRPMLVAIKLKGDSALLSINGEEVISLTLDPSQVEFPTEFITIDNVIKKQDFIGIYAYEDVPSIEIDCIGIYPYIVPDIVEKRRFVYGQGVDVPEAIVGSGSDSTVTIDYPVANYAKNYLYPDIGRWNQGINENLEINNTSISSPTYELPTLFFSNESESSWYSDIESIQVSGLEPFINLKPNVLYDEAVSVWDNTEAYILFDSISTLSQDLEAFYGIFMPNYSAGVKQTLFFIEDEESSNYFEIFINEDNEIVYELAVANSDTAGGYDKEVIYTYQSEESTMIPVGINIDSFANTYGGNVLDFFGKVSTLKFYVAGSRFLENTFDGNIVSVGFCTARNLQKILSLFNTNGTIMTLEDYESDVRLYDGGNVVTTIWEATVDAGNTFFGSSSSGFISIVDGGSPFGILTTAAQRHTASYTLLPKNYLGKFMLDIATNGYWQDHVPLGYFGKYVNAGDGTEYYELDFLQFNISYPNIHKYLEGIYDTENSVVKTFVSFDYMQDDASIDIVGYTDGNNEPRLTRLEPAPSSNVITPGSNWAETLYEITNDTVIYPPSDTDFNDLALVLHVEVISNGIMESPVEIESLQIASTALNSFVPNPVGTKNGKEIFPYLRSSGYFDYKGKNPYSIYKGTSPYLYLTGNSGIKLLDFKENAIDRGISIPINTEKTPYYKLSAIQLSARYDAETFPNRVVEVMEVESKEGTFKIYMAPEDGRGTRARLYPVDAQTGLPYNNLVFFVNGIPVTEAIVEINSWFMIAIVFNSALDFSSASGAIRMTGPLLFNNLSYYKTRESDEVNRSTYRKWFGVSVIDGEGVPWDYWKSGVPEIGVPQSEWAIQPFTWRTVLYATLLPSAAVDGETLYRKFTGTNRFTVDTDSLLRIRNYKYSAYNATGWQTKVTSPV
jgi:hypothetical protein